MHDHPTAFLLAQTEGDPQPLLRVRRAVLCGAAAQQRPREGDVVAGGDVESLTQEQQAVVRSARRRGNLWFYPCLVGTVASVGYLC